MSSPPPTTDNASGLAPVSPASALRPSPGQPLTELPVRPLTSPSGTEGRADARLAGASDPGAGKDSLALSQPGSAPTESPAVNLAAQQDKKSRPIALSQRSSGPSLLSQALASARGIQSPVLEDRSHGNTGRETSKSPPAKVSSNSKDKDRKTSSVPAGSAARAREDGSLEGDDGGSVTPLGSPRHNNMAETAVMAAPLLQSPEPPSLAHDILDFATFNTTFQDHRQYLTTSRERGNSLERVGSPRSPPGPRRAETFSHGSGGAGHLSNALDGMESQRTLVVDDDASRPSRPQHLRRTADQRLSMGPEKIWSIGQEDSTGDGSGQVEKSVTEILSGIEHNARSRKASHSLRFFREGLPEEPGRKRPPRPGSQHREKAPGSAIEQAAGGSNSAQIPPLSTPPVDRPSPTAGSVEAISTQGKVPDRVGQDHSAEEYFPTRAKDTAGSTMESAPDRDEVPTNHLQSRPSLPTPSDTGPSVAAAEHTEHAEEVRRQSGDSTEIGESADDADDSSEEKISSAVFLLHQGIEAHEHLEQADDVVPQHLRPGLRTPGRAENVNTWLVKADEPEAEAKIPTEGADAKEPAKKHVALSPPGIEKKDAKKRDTLDDPEASKVQQSRPSWPVYEYEDRVHVHQLIPEQPLEAIELIPYKHQVGGHTTLWRFSKRAVCKQLNNRENEFYERIERYHRDLLPFLPRYIGVLNVTFQRQPRRRSTVKREDGVADERKLVSQAELTVAVRGDTTAQEAAAQMPAVLHGEDGQNRVISQSLRPTPVPTVTFVDNQHILPRNLLQPTHKAASLPGRFRRASAGFSIESISASSQDAKRPNRPRLEDHHSNSWGATTINKRLRNEVFNDAFLKEPVDIQKHRKAHQRSLPRRSPHSQAQTMGSNLSRIVSAEPDIHVADAPAVNGQHAGVALREPKSLSDLGPTIPTLLSGDDEPEDITGTSAPEPEIVAEPVKVLQPEKRKRRYSGNALRRKPADVDESRGSLKYYEEADDAGYKGDAEDLTANAAGDVLQIARGSTAQATTSNTSSTAASGTTSPTAEFKRIPRPVNPKEARAQRDSRVEYFLLLEDLTAGMHRPCIMDLKMGTRQYGVDANAKKQASQQGKCAQTTSKELGVRVCGLQVWDVGTQKYVFKDKYYGRRIKAGDEFQHALTRFLYDGVDETSILRHIHNILDKLSRLEVIIRRLRGYRFYAASLLMFYDGAPSPLESDAYIDDSTTDFATDTEERDGRSTRPKKDPREIDFKMADFANSVTAGDLAKDKPCPPQHPDQPDYGFLRGLKSLRKYFLKIQRDTRADLGMPLGMGQPGSSGLSPDGSGDEDEGEISN